MAVSQGKMLGHYTRGPGGYKCFCCQDPGTTRWRKRIEQQQARQEIAEQVRDIDNGLDIPLDKTGA